MPRAISHDDARWSSFVAPESKHLPFGAVLAATVAFSPPLSSLGGFWQRCRVMTWCVLWLSSLAPGHVPGLSQASVVVDIGDEAVVVDIDTVFARADAARLHRPWVIATAGDKTCETLHLSEEDVEGDGRALAVKVRCTLHGDVVLDVRGLAALPAQHRLVARVMTDQGIKDRLLSPADTVVSLVRPQDLRGPKNGLRAVLFLGVIAVVFWGARRQGPLLQTMGFFCVGAGLSGALLAAFASVASAASTAQVVERSAVVDVVGVVVAVCAIASVAFDSLPRARPVALALGAFVAYVWAS